MLIVELGDGNLVGRLMSRPFKGKEVMIPKIKLKSSPAPPKGLYRLQPPAARSVAATNVTSVYQTDVTSAAPTNTLCLCSNVSVGPADIKSVWATNR
ncbi:hypothetical protein PCANC_27930 [Puccinia coronata f. sp. avenae]|uniref:Uncharacterized protein n=1 Tax=Puccinia coronata f. sp. avenae TaxID=200324 RepID=A0A2N5S666_9BASI|nr:hypothetical protein PCANC_27930 [Puccinia coronata f. sp. avenae]